MKMQQSEDSGTKWFRRGISYAAVPVFYLMVNPSPACAMHIMEGFLPPKWALLWWLLCLPFLALGIRNIKRITAERPSLRILIAMAGGFAFVLSAMKLPSIAGSSSHPTGVGLGAIIFGPCIMTVIGFIVLVFQSLILAHGGITTLGANACSMAIAGPLAAWCTYRCLKRMKAPFGPRVFFAAAAGDLVTYAVTSLQLALAFPDPQGGFLLSLAKFSAIFAVTQIPLALLEGLLTVVIMKILYVPEKEALRELSVIGEERA
jgi:cobalt/nickel transport system permease protein